MRTEAIVRLWFEAIREEAGLVSCWSRLEPLQDLSGPGKVPAAGRSSPDRARLRRIERALSNLAAKRAALERQLMSERATSLKDILSKLHIIASKIDAVDHDNALPILRTAIADLLSYSTKRRAHVVARGARRLQE